MTTTHPPYRISYTQAPDGKVSISVDISGPLPDPLAGMSPEERRDVTRQSLSFSEYVTLWSVRKLPAAARHVVWVEILARRRQAYERRLAADKEQTAIERLHQPLMSVPHDDREPEQGR